MKTKIAYENIPIQILAGGDTFRKKYSFKNRGTAVRIALSIVSTTPPDKFLRIGIDNTSGKEILAPIHYKMFTSREGGSYFEAMMPVDFDTSRDIEIYADANGSLGADFKADFIIYVEDPQNPVLVPGASC